MPSMTFAKRVKSLLQEYDDTSLQNRWKEATSFGDAAQADAFWIRNSSDLVNIVWLNKDGIRDLTFLSDSKESMFNFLPLKSISTFEIREREHIAELLGLRVEGYLVIHVVVPSQGGQVYWVANTKNDARALRTFLKAVMQAYSHQK